MRLVAMQKNNHGSLAISIRSRDGAQSRHFVCPNFIALHTGLIFARLTGADRSAIYPRHESISGSRLRNRWRCRPPN